MIPYDWSYMIDPIWLPVYDMDRIWSHIWLTIYDCAYMITSIWHGPYMIPYMIDHIWLTVYDYPYMIDRILQSPYMIPYMTDHICLHVYDSIYDYHIWSNRIWLTVYDCPYMRVIYDRDRIWSTIYGQSYMVFRIWSYVVTIYGSVYDDHIWSPPTIIYGLHMRCMWKLFVPYLVPKKSIFGTVFFHIWVQKSNIWVTHMVTKFPNMKLKNPKYGIVYRISP